MSNINKNVNLIHNSIGYKLCEKILTLDDPIIYIQQYLWCMVKPNTNVIDYFKNIKDSEKKAIYFYKKYSNTNKVAIDLGSWVGFHSILLSKINKKIISIECDPISVLNTKYNLDLNNCNNYTIYDKPISKDHTIVNVGSNTFSDSQGGWNGSCSMIHTNEIKYKKTDYGYEASVLKMETITFSDIVKDLKPEQISLIKIDIESSEEFILEDILKFCNRKIPILCSFHIKIFHQGDWHNWWKDQNLENKIFLKQYNYYDIVIENEIMNEIPINDIIDFLNKNPICEIIIK